MKVGDSATVSFTVQILQKSRDCHVMTRGAVAGFPVKLRCWQSHAGTAV